MTGHDTFFSFFLKKQKKLKEKNAGIGVVGCSDDVTSCQDDCGDCNICCHDRMYFFVCTETKKIYNYLYFSGMARKRTCWLVSWCACMSFSFFFNFISWYSPCVPNGFMLLTITSFPFLRLLLFRQNSQRLLKKHGISIPPSFIKTMIFLTKKTLMHTQQQLWLQTHN